MLQDAVNVYCLKVIHKVKFWQMG